MRTTGAGSNLKTRPDHGDTPLVLDFCIFENYRKSEGQPARGTVKSRGRGGQHHPRWLRARDA
jgi:hypothetical protein